jgi:branched-chain amino acid transport system ATP-binding protein
MLEVSGLTAGYHGQDVVMDVSRAVRAGEAVTIIGSNGSGKTTLFRAVCGLLSASHGRVLLGGTDITGWPPERVARAGLAYVPAERHLFPRMTVRENLALGAYPRRPDRAAFDLVYRLFPRLGERHSQTAGSLSGGEQQMLAVGRALMSRPRLLVLDEPSTGLAPKLARSVYASLGLLKDEDLSLLVAEQQLPLALGLADRGYVLENGRVRLEGQSEELARNPDVRHAYLGIT